MLELENARVNQVGVEGLCAHNLKPLFHGEPSSCRAAIVLIATDNFVWVITSLPILLAGKLEFHRIQFTFIVCVLVASHFHKFLSSLLRILSLPE